MADAAVSDLLLSRAHELADRPALIDGASGHTTRYGGLADGVRRIAAGLAARGFGRGDVLAINAPNAPEWPLPVLGALAAGGTVTTANPLHTADELAPQLADARARILGRRPRSTPTTWRCCSTRAAPPECPRA
jgi:acyl-CoA synthetase (AMP-forming)/AMP-acid ligase II